MKYKILIQKSEDLIFTYITDKYEIDDFFIRFTDDRGQPRLIPKSKICEVLRFE